MRVRIVILALVVLLTLFGSLPIFLCFTIKDGRSGDIVFADKAEKYKKFYISFRHSVNRTPVNEYYRIEGNNFVLEKANFYSYGAGMPEAGEYGSGKPTIKDGMVQIDDINKVFKRFTYIAGTYADHSLNTDDGQIFFSSFVKPQTSVTFGIKRVSVFTLLRLTLQRIIYKQE